MNTHEHCPHIARMKLRYEYTCEGTINCHHNNTLVESEYGTPNESDQDDTNSEHHTICLGNNYESAKDENTTSTLSSIYNNNYDSENQKPAKLETTARLNNLINTLEDECSTTNVGVNRNQNIVQESFKVDKPIQPQVSFDENEKDKVPRMDWNNYHRLDVIHSFMDKLEYDYPSICTTGAIGKSVEGRELKILKISNSDTTNSSVWIDAGIHAREWIAPAVATYVADHIARNFTCLPTNVTNKDWYFLPVVNPDGYEYSHTVDRMWRKNRAYYAGQCVGVDLNRNFSCGWGGKGSSGNPTNVFYRGPEPFSEPESSAIRDMLLSAGISFKIYITLHSYGQVIIFPFAHKEELCPDYVRLLEGATAMSKAINECNGNIYRVGISKDVMYGAAGTSYDYSYGSAGVPFAYLIELRSRQHRFKLPKEEIEETGNEILNCVIALTKFVDEKYPDGIYDCSGNTFKVGISRDILYGAAGTSNDFSYGTVGIPFCYLIELRSKRHRFRLPKEEIEDSGREILSGILSFMEFVDKQMNNSIKQQTVAEWESASE